MLGGVNFKGLKCSSSLPKIDGMAEAKNTPKLRRSLKVVGHRSCRPLSQNKILGKGLQDGWY